MTEAGQAWSPALIERVVVGELSVQGAASDSLTQLARHAYAEGAAYAFVTAAAIALVAMLLTNTLMARRSSQG